MARNTFGGGPADFALTTTSGTWRNAGPATCPVWSAEAGGVQLTDLLIGGAAVTSVRIGSTGRIPAFQGPDGYEEVWLEVPGMPGRYRLTRIGGIGPAGAPGATGATGAKGDTGPQGERGLPGLNSVPTDAAVSELARTQGTELNATLSDFVGTEVDTVAAPATRSQVARDQPFTLTRIGQIATDKQAWEAAAQDGPGSVYLDPTTGKLRMTYPAYDSLSASTGRGVIGTRESRDGLSWTNPEVWLEPSGVTGAPDRYGVTGGVRVADSTTEYAFYIGLDQPGYEQGTKRLCMAHRPLGAGIGAWVREGAVITPSGTGWRSQFIWKPCFFTYKGEIYCFLNASGTPSGFERVGVFRSTSRTYMGPWVEVTNTSGASVNPLFADTGTAKIQQGDPVVFVWNDQPAMMFFRATTADPKVGSIMLSTTTWEQFPTGWTPGVAVLSSTDADATYDNRYAHKGFPFEFNGRWLVPYTAVTTGEVRSLAIAASGGPLPVRRGETLPGDLVNYGSIFVASGQNAADQLMAKLVARGQLTVETGIFLDTFDRAAGPVGTADSGQTAPATTGFSLDGNGNLLFNGSADTIQWWDLPDIDGKRIIVDFDLTQLSGTYPFGFAWGGSSTWSKVYRNGNNWAAANQAGTGLMTPIFMAFGVGTLRADINIPTKTVTLTQGSNTITFTPSGLVSTATRFGIAGSGGAAGTPLRVSRMVIRQAT